MLLIQLQDVSIRPSQPYEQEERPTLSVAKGASGYNISIEPEQHLFGKYKQAS
jgi:hypothetical protein